MCDGQLMCGAYVKWPPTAVIFPKKCGRWHFENAVGRENPALQNDRVSYATKKEDGRNRLRKIRVIVQTRNFCCWKRRIILRSPQRLF